MEAKVKTGLLIAVLGLLTLIFCTNISRAKGESNRIKCDVHVGPCSGTLNSTQVSLDIKPKPVKAMEELLFTVTFAGEKPVADPHIDLGMPGMNMGRNRVILKPTGQSVFQGKGVIVR